MIEIEDHKNMNFSLFDSDYLRTCNIRQSYNTFWSVGCQMNKGEKK